MGKVRSRYRFNIIFAILFLFLISNYQNCAPTGGTKSSLGNATKSSSDNQYNIQNPGSSTTSSSPFTVGNGGSNQINNSPFTVGSGGSPTSGGSTTGTNGGKCGENINDFCFRQDLQDATITLVSNGITDSGYTQLKYNVVSPSSSNGKITYNWYKDNKLIKSDNRNYFISDYSVTVYAYDYTPDGNYYLEVSDEKTQKKIKSRIARLRVVENEAGCAAGTYWASKVDPLGESYLKVSGRFSNKYGKWLLHNDYVNMSGYFLSNNQNSRSFNITAGTYGQLSSISCSHFVPNLHENDYSSDYPSCPRYQCSGEFYYGQCAPPANPPWAGQITVKCMNNKWVMVANTCSWQGAQVYSCGYPASEGSTANTGLGFY